MDNLDNPHSCLALTVSFSFWSSVLNQIPMPEFIVAAGITGSACLEEC